MYDLQKYGSRKISWNIRIPKIFEVRLLCLLNKNDRYPFFSTFLGDSDGVDLTLFLLFESNTVYSKSLPDFNFYKQNFPHLWNDDLLEILPLEQNQKYQYIRRLEEKAYESLRREFEKIGRKLKFEKFLWARHANILWKNKNYFAFNEDL